MNPESGSDITLSDGGQIRRVRARSEATTNSSLEDHEYLDRLEQDGFDRTDVRAPTNTSMQFLGETTPFAFYCIKGDLDMAQWLFAHGAAPDCHVLTESGLSPLALACRVQCLPLVRWLLSLGVDINGGGGPWISPLFCATMFSRGGSPEVPLFLIDQGAETRNTSTANKRTVTHAAAENGLVPILEALHSVQLAEERELHVMRIPPLLRRMTKEGFLEHVLQVMEGMVDDAELSPAELRNELREDFGHLWDDSPVATRTDLQAVDGKEYTPLRLVVCPFYIGAYFEDAVAGRVASAQWLILHGALSGEDGHCDPLMVRRDMTRPSNRHGDDRAPDIRPALLEWARGLVAQHHAFRQVVLPGTCSPRTSAHIWKLNSLGDESSCFLKRTVAAFLGIEHGRRLRTAREFAAALGDIDMAEEGPPDIEPPQDTGEEDEDEDGDGE